MGCSKICLAVIMAVLAVSLMSSAEAQNTPSCASKLVSCAGDLNSTKTPSNTCCNAIKEAVNNELTCLCNLYNTPGLLQGFGVSVDQAIRLTKDCGVPVELNKCTNSSAGSPLSQPPPPGVPGADNNGVERMAWTGISTFFLFFVSAMFY